MRIERGPAAAHLFRARHDFSDFNQRVVELGARPTSFSSRALRDASLLAMRKPLKAFITGKLHRQR